MGSPLHFIRLMFYEAWSCGGRQRRIDFPLKTFMDEQQVVAAKLDTRNLIEPVEVLILLKHRKSTGFSLYLRVCVDSLEAERAAEHIGH